MNEFICNRNNSENNYGFWNSRSVSTIKRRWLPTPPPCIGNPVVCGKPLAKPRIPSRGFLYTRGFHFRRLQADGPWPWYVPQGFLHMVWIRNPVCSTGNCIMYSDYKLFRSFHGLIRGFHFVLFGCNPSEQTSQEPQGFPIHKGFPFLLFAILLFISKENGQGFPRAEFPIHGGG